MLNNNNNLQTQTSNALHNDIMEAGGKDRPPMLAPGSTIQVAEGSSETTTEGSQQATRNRGKAIVNSSALIYDQEPAMVTEDDEMSKEKEIDKLMALISLSETIDTQVVKKYGIQCYNCKEYGHVSRECQKPKRAKNTAYHKENMLLCKQEEAKVQLNAEQAGWKDDTDDESDDQELEAHYMYMAKIQ
ncbi:retrovirus-related pol polyprotein from transposon TNT 1-94 [Tanacetum coccineum]